MSVAVKYGDVLSAFLISLSSYQYNILITLMLKSNGPKIEHCETLYSIIVRLLKQSLILACWFDFWCESKLSKRLNLVSKSLNYLFQSEAQKFRRPFLVLSPINEDCENSIHTSAKSRKTASRVFVWRPHKNFE